MKCDLCRKETKGREVTLETHGPTESRHFTSRGMCIPCGEKVIDMIEQIRLDNDKERETKRA